VSHRQSHRSKWISPDHVITEINPDEVVAHTLRKDRADELMAAGQLTILGMLPYIVIRDAIVGQPDRNRRVVAIDIAIAQAQTYAKQQAR
jgi:hypothetical protein